MRTATEAAAFEGEVDVAAGARGEVTLAGRIDRPRLWGPAHPHLYTVHDGAAQRRVRRRRRRGADGIPRLPAGGRALPAQRRPHRAARRGQAPGDGVQPGRDVGRGDPRGLRQPPRPRGELRAARPLSPRARSSTTWPTRWACWCGPRTAIPTSTRRPIPATTSRARWSARTTTTPASCSGRWATRRGSCASTASPPSRAPRTPTASSPTPATPGARGRSATPTSTSSPTTPTAAGTAGSRGSSSRRRSRWASSPRTAPAR